MESLEGSRCGVIFKFHHAMTDGVGMVRMTEGLVERGPDETLPAMASGLSRHREKLGVTPNELRMSIPINVCGDEKGRHAGNQFVPAHASRSI